MENSVSTNSISDSFELERENSNKKEIRFFSKIQINREKLPLKIAMFVFYGAMSSILPYLTVHMQFLGISVTDTAFIYAALPFAAFAGPAILGALADRTRKYTLILIIATIGHGIFHTALLFTPQYQPATDVNITGRVVLNTNSSTEFLYPDESRYCNFKPSILNKDLDLHDCEPSYASDDIEDFPCAIEFYPQTVNITFKYTEGHQLGEVTTKLACKINMKTQSPEIGNRQVTFWVYFVIRVIATMFMGSAVTLLDATTLAVLKRCGNLDYGKERLWAILGVGVTSPIAGFLVDIFSDDESSNFSPAFYFCDALIVLCIITFYFIDIQGEKPEKGLLKSAKRLLKYPEVVVFLLTIFLLGCNAGFLEGYLFLFLDDLGAPNYLLGLTVTVGAVFGIPFLWTSETIVAKFGRVNCILTAFFVYSIRFVGYSFLKDPFWCFPFEVMEAYTNSFMWAAAVTYAANLAPKGLLASLMGMMGALHHSLGKGIGTFLGGMTYGEVGARSSFLYFGIGSIIIGIIFFVLDIFLIRKIVAKRTKKSMRGRSNIQE